MTNTDPNRCGYCKCPRPADGFGTRTVRGQVVQYKRCKPCRERAKVYDSDPKVKARRVELRPSYRAADRAFNHRPDVKAAREKFQKSAEGRASTKASIERVGRATKKAWSRTAAGKASCARRNKTKYVKMMASPAKKLHERIRLTIVSMLRGRRLGSATVEKWTDFKDADAIEEHMEKLFQGGMNVGNYGQGAKKWNIGHRIARIMYDHSNADDVRRCWSAANIFPQWQRENFELGTKLPDTQELYKLRPYWPISWNDNLPSPQQRTQLERAHQPTWSAP